MRSAGIARITSTSFGEATEQTRPHVEMRIAGTIHKAREGQPLGNPCCTLEASHTNREVTMLANDDEDLSPSDWILQAAAALREHRSRPCLVLVDPNLRRGNEGRGGHGQPLRTNLFQDRPSPRRSGRARPRVGFRLREADSETLSPRRSGQSARGNRAPDDPRLSVARVCHRHRRTQINRPASGRERRRNDHLIRNLRADRQSSLKTLDQQTKERRHGITLSIT